MSEHQPQEVTIIDLQNDVASDCQGEANPAFESGETSEGKQGETSLSDNAKDRPEELPPLTYIDFHPQCVGSVFDDKIPEFDKFKSLVEQANQWLASMPQFSVYKCETQQHRLMGGDFKLDNDQTLTHISSGGKSYFIRTLRLWLVPRAEPNTPIQQLAYVTVLPDHNSGSLSNFLASVAGQSVPTGQSGTTGFDTLSATVEKLNKHLGVKPLPGRILSAETVTFKCMEHNTSDKLDAEGSSWSEGAVNNKLFVHGVRIFYVLGQPAYETIGVHDELPEIHQNQEGFGVKVKFSDFSTIANRAGKWLQRQQGLRVVNIQSVNIKLERKAGTGPWALDSDSSSFSRGQSLQETRYTKIMRILYVRDQKLANPSPYSSVNLTSRIFVPIRLAGKNFETFSKTMLRVIKWLNATRIPVFACETVRYQINSEGEGQGFNDERTDYLVNTLSGRYYLTCIRLYFPSVFQEPPEEIGGEVDVAWGWRCVIS